MRKRERKITPMWTKTRMKTRRMSSVKAVMEVVTKPVAKPVMKTMVDHRIFLCLTSFYFSIPEFCLRWKLWKLWYFGMSDYVGLNVVWIDFWNVWNVLYCLINLNLSFVFVFVLVFDVWLLVLVFDVGYRCWCWYLMLVQDWKVKLQKNLHFFQK